MPLMRFQQAAVNRIVEALGKPNGSKRYLLADEVGLGKTLVAKGVIEKLNSQQSGRALTVVYICSSTEIIEQNKNRLVDPFEFSTERLTLLPIYSRKIAERRRGQLPLLFSFTPGTSFSVGRGSGNKRERQLLLYLLLNRGHAAHSALWREFFRGGCTRNGWEKDFRTAGLKSCFERPDENRKIEEKYIRDFSSRLRKLRVKDYETKEEVRLLDNLDRWVHGEIPQQKNLVISKLRECLATVCLEFINPDLIIMDEFQRFTDTMQNFGKEGTLEFALIAKDQAKILILSATPYRMYQTREEEHSHYSEFYKALSFLFRENEKDGPKITRLRDRFENFREQLEGGEVVGKGSSILKLKNQIERDLKEVMCRTERYWYIEEANKGVLEIPAGGKAMKELIPRKDELAEYARLQQFLLNKGMGSVAVDFWKSCPSILTFMDSNYKFIQKVKKQKVPESLLRHEGKQEDNLPLRNLKFRLLLAKVLDNELEEPRQHDEGNRNPWRHLWIPPIYQYYCDPSDLAAEGRPYKFLIFSHWRFVPRAIAAIVSRQIEIRCPKLDFKERGPLKFASEKTTLFPFDICFPSLRLAREIHPLQLALTTGKAMNSSQFISAAREKILMILDQAGIKDGPQAPSDWKVIARLEATGRDAAVARRLIEKSSVDNDESASYKRHTEMYLRYFHDDSNLTVSAGQVDKILRIALFSPAQAMLRSAISMLAKPSDNSDIEEIYRESLKLGVNQLRNYFNRPFVQAVIRQTGSGRHYNDQVLDYCRRGHFQEMLDEYCYLMVEALQKKPQREKEKHPFKNFFDYLAGVLETHSGSTSMNIGDAAGNFLDNKYSQSAHFALAFGETETEVDGEERKRLRGTTVRDAFNSPFWPFVLATTSRGQEGLDFHLYCRDIIHWNLPSNPVDLEQREGRINRYDGLCIRQSIRNDYNLVDLNWKVLSTSDIPNLWKIVFASIDEDPNRSFSTHYFKHGLDPHWIFVPRDQTRKNILIRRHLLFYYGSRDYIRYRRLKRDLGFYRLALGQPRQQDMIEEIQAIMERKGKQGEANLEHLMINLSPIDPDDIWIDCKKGAKKISQDPTQISDLNQRVRQLCQRKANCLFVVRKEIDDLLKFTSEGATKINADIYQLVEALAALLYLFNPYDRIYDRFPEIGFDDDIEMIRKVHSELGLRN